MTVRISGLFSAYDDAENAVRSLTDISVLDRRISHLSGRTLGDANVPFSPLSPGYVVNDTASFPGSAPNGMPGLIFPAIPSDVIPRTEPGRSREVQLEVWVPAGDAKKTVRQLINAHAYSVRQY